MKALEFLNSILLPFKLLLPQPIVKKVPFLTTNEDIRIQRALHWMSGKTLDIGCGDNRLINEYRQKGGEGIGVDVYNWGKQDLVVEDTARLPFDDAEFDTVTMIACINHIPNREAVLKEVHRVLRPYGRLVLTNLTPALSYVWHRYAFWDEDQHKRGMKAGEVYGLSTSLLLEMLARADLTLEHHSRFSLRLNAIYVCRKK